MPVLRLLPWLLFVVVSACATAPSTTPAPAFFVVRHLHTPAGERDPDLTVEGLRQAELLADRLAGQRIAAIYVSDFRRTRQTASPLGERLGLAPIVYDPADTPALVARAKAGARPALIVGHSNTVPDIVQQLGGTRPPPLVHGDFGDIWLIGADGSTMRTQISAVAAE